MTTLLHAWLTKISVVFALLSVLTLTGCKDDEPDCSREDDDDSLVVEDLPVSDQIETRMDVNAVIFPDFVTF